MMSRILVNLKEFFAMTNNNVFTISVLTALLALIFAVGYVQYSRDKSLERNIESAIVKGIDPIAVKCAYESNSTMCALYATTVKK